ncbi:MAG: hypothetical protein ACREB3_01580, partial [Burkholderiales bacterium]
GKGSGTYGQFRLTTEDDHEFIEVIKSGGRAAQIEAMEAAKPYDEESEELLVWYNSELKRRGIKVAA